MKVRIAFTTFISALVIIEIANAGRLSKAWNVIEQHIPEPINPAKPAAAVSDLISDTTHAIDRVGGQAVSDIKESTKLLERSGDVPNQFIRRLEEGSMIAEIMNEIGGQIKDPSEDVFDRLGNGINKTKDLFESGTEKLDTLAQEIDRDLIQSSLADKICEIAENSASAAKINGALDRNISSYIKTMDLMFPISGILEKIDVTGTSKCLREDLISLYANEPSLALQENRAEGKAKVKSMIQKCVDKHLVSKIPDHKLSVGKLSISSRQAVFANKSMAEFFVKLPSKLMTDEEFKSVMDRELFEGVRTFDLIAPINGLWEKIDVTKTSHQARVGILTKIKNDPELLAPDRRPDLMNMVAAEVSASAQRNIIKSDLDGKSTALFRDLRRSDAQKSLADSDLELEYGELNEFYTPQRSQFSSSFADVDARLQVIEDLEFIQRSLHKDYTKTIPAMEGMDLLSTNILRNENGALTRILFSTPSITVNPSYWNAYLRSQQRMVSMLATLNRWNPQIIKLYHRSVEAFSQEEYYGTLERCASKNISTIKNDPLFDPKSESALSIAVSKWNKIKVDSVRAKYSNRSIAITLKKEISDLLSAVRNLRQKFAAERRLISASYSQLMGFPYNRYESFDVETLEDTNYVFENSTIVLKSAERLSNLPSEN